MKRMYLPLGLFFISIFLLFSVTACKSDSGSDPILSLTASPAPQGETAPPSPSAPTDTPLPTDTPAPTEVPMSYRLERYVSSMTTEEKIGQVVMFGFSGTSKLSSAFGELMDAYRIGNVILYGDNISRSNSDGGFARCKKLTAALRSRSAGEIPLLIAIDVEGGSVTRFHWDTSLLSARTLGNREDTDRAREQFRYIGEGLMGVGLNVNLAPVMDVAENPTSTFLGKRIISSSADIVSSIGTACIEGLHESGCLAFVKHFPGHGATTADSHETTPKVKKTLEELWEYELIPFAAAVNAGADGVMVGHISYPNIDAEHIASQSYTLITEVLRGQMGFEGVVMSDDFRMKGLRNRTSLKAGAVQFILAGGDLILCGPNHSYQREILQGLTEAVESGAISEDRLNESVVRILTAKMKATGWEPA